MLETHASPEWLHWENVINGEVDGKIARGVWQLVDFPGGKAVLGTTMVFKQKLDQYGRIEKYKKMPTRDTGFPINETGSLHGIFLLDPAAGKH